MHSPFRFPLRRGLVLAAALVALAACGFRAPASASVPTLMNYQGFLADNAGNPANGSYAITFRLYPDSLTTTALWTESYTGVSVSAGVFNVLLGSVSPLSTTLLDGHKLWLLTTVNGTDVLPRRPVVSVAYAFRAMVADSAVRAGASGGDITGQVQVNCASSTGPALIYIPGRSFVAYAASDGTFDLGNVPPGTYKVHIEAAGSGSTNVANVVVNAGGVTSIGIVALGANTQTDVNNCGACGNVCSSNNDTPSCVAGTCQLACNAGYGDCDLAANNGCEANLQNSVTNCGNCGHVCPSGPNSSGLCTSGACQLACNSGYRDCNNNPSDGCEVGIYSDLNNCGACGNVCPAMPNAATTCSVGTCQLICNAGYLNCNGFNGDGCEVNTTSDANNCGGCGHVCAGGHPCVNSVCQ